LIKSFQKDSIFLQHVKRPQEVVLLPPRYIQHFPVVHDHLAPFALDVLADLVLVDDMRVMDADEDIRRQEVFKILEGTGYRDLLIALEEE
jgi:hypothetical protein